MDTQRRLEAMERRDFEAYKRDLRRLERQGLDVPDPDEEFTTAVGNWHRSDAGYPLGASMPPGRTLRADGQSHRQAWMAVVRADPCSYCHGEGGTVDHVDPRARRLPLRADLHTWLNVTGACESCNGSKGSTSLLLWLAHRRVLAS